MENNSTWTPSAPSPTTWPSKSFPIARSILAAVGAAAVALVPAALYLIYLAAHGLVPKHAAPTQIPVVYVLISQAASYVPLIVYLLAVVPPLAKRSLRELGLRLPTAREIVAGVVGAPIMVSLVLVVSAALGMLTQKHETEASVALLHELRTPLEMWGFVLMAIVFAPMVEEFAFRVFLFNAIQRHSTTTIATIVSGLLFGLVHGFAITIAIPIAVGGMVLALVYARTRCYWSSVITHGLFNATSVIAALVFHVSDS